MGSGQLSFGSGAARLRPHSATADAPPSDVLQSPGSKILAIPSLSRIILSRFQCEGDCRFHYPAGKPVPAVDVEAGIKRLSAIPKPALRFEDMPDVVKVIFVLLPFLVLLRLSLRFQALGLPLYWKKPVWLAAGGVEGGSVSAAEVGAWWRGLCGAAHDEAARFVAVLKGRLEPLHREDFEPMIQVRKQDASRRDGKGRMGWCRT